MYVAVCCSVLQFLGGEDSPGEVNESVLQCVSECCSVLWCAGSGNSQGEVHESVL